MFTRHRTPSYVAVHDLGGSGPAVLYAHPTGFHGRCWQPVADQLPQFHNIAPDARGHGDTPIPPGWDVDWAGYADDAGAVAADLTATDGPVVAVGHSMGGAALLIAALAEPSSFRSLVLYEPIVLPPGTPTAHSPNEMAVGARRRRSTFHSFEEAIANYSSKPPLNSITAQAVEAYVRGGFILGGDGKVHLKCRPEHEARTFEAARHHDTWDHLGGLQVPVWVLCGRPEENGPSALAAQVAERIPNSRYIQLDHLDHFGPLQAPDEFAALVAEAAATFP